MVIVNAVGEIFTAAGMAFGRLAELTSLLQPTEEQTSTADSNGGSNDWDADDIEALKSAVSKFGQDLALVTERIKGKKVTAKSEEISNKVFEDAGESRDDSKSNHETTGDSVKNEMTDESLEESFMKEDGVIETTEVTTEETIIASSQPSIDTSSIDLPADS